MNIDIKKLFEADEQIIPIRYELDLSGIKWWGGKPFQSPAVVSGTVQNKLGIVTINYSVEAVLSAVCDRCLKAEEKKIIYHFEHGIVLSLNGDDNDEYIVVEDGILNLDELVSADIVLELPIKALCKEECKGLCPKCGTNLNETSCGCVTKTVDPRLEVLLGLLD